MNRRKYCSKSMRIIRRSCMLPSPHSRTTFKDAQTSTECAHPFHCSDQASESTQTNENSESIHAAVHDVDAGTTCSVVPDDLLNATGDFQGPLMSCPHCQKTIEFVSRTPSDDIETLSVNTTSHNFHRSAENARKDIEKTTGNHLQGIDLQNLKESQGQGSRNDFVLRNSNTANFVFRNPSDILRSRSSEERTFESSKNSRFSKVHGKNGCIDTEETADACDLFEPVRHGVKRKRSDEDMFVGQHRSNYCDANTEPERNDVFSRVLNSLPPSTVSSSEPPIAQRESTNSREVPTYLEESTGEQLPALRDKPTEALVGPMRSDMSWDSKKSCWNSPSCSDETMASASSVEDMKEDGQHQDSSSPADSEDSFLNQINIGISWNQSLSMVEIENRIARVRKYLFEGNEETSLGTVASGEKSKLAGLEKGGSYSEETVRTTLMLPSDSANGTQGTLTQGNHNEQDKHAPNRSGELNISMEFPFTGTRPFNSSQKLLSPLNDSPKLTPAITPERKNNDVRKEIEDISNLQGISLISYLKKKSDQKLEQQLREKAKRVEHVINTGLKQSLQNVYANGLDGYLGINDRSDMPEIIPILAPPSTSQAERPSNIEGTCARTNEAERFSGDIVSSLTTVADRNREFVEYPSENEPVTVTPTYPELIHNKRETETSPRENEITMKCESEKCSTFVAPEECFAGSRDNISEQEYLVAKADNILESHANSSAAASAYDFQANTVMENEIEGDICDNFATGRESSTPETDSSVPMEANSLQTEALPDRKNAGRDDNEVRSASDPGFVRSILNFFQYRRPTSRRSKRTGVRKRSKSLKARHYKDLAAGNSVPPLKSNSRRQYIAIAPDANGTTSPSANESRGWINQRLQFMNVWRSISEPVIPTDEDIDNDPWAENPGISSTRNQDCSKKMDQSETERKR